MEIIYFIAGMVSFILFCNIVWNIGRTRRNTNEMVKLLNEMKKKQDAEGRP